MTVRAEEEIRDFLATPVPPGAEDLRDLGVIGYANELAGISPAMLAGLITKARGNGRSWDDIGRALDQTAAEAEATYRKLTTPRPPAQQPAPWRRRTAALIRAIGGVIDDGLGRVADELSREHIRR